MTKQYSNSTVG